DATAKVPSGVFEGTLLDLGAYDECIETVIHDTYGNEKVRGQYCNVYLKTGNDTSVFDHMAPAIQLSHRRALELTKSQKDDRVPGVRLGLCMLADCTKEDIQAIADTMTDGMMQVTVKDCVTNHPPTMTSTQKGILIFLGSLALIMALSTLADFWLLRQGTENSNRGIEKTTLLETETEIGLGRKKEHMLNSGNRVSPLTLIHQKAPFSLPELPWILFRRSQLLGSERSDILRPVTEVELHNIGNAIKKQNKKDFAAYGSRTYSHVTQITVPYIRPSLYFTTQTYERSFTKPENFFKRPRNPLKQRRALRAASSGYTKYVINGIVLFISINILIEFKMKPKTTIGIFIGLSLASCSYNAWQMHGTSYMPYNLPVPATIQDFMDTMNNMYVLPTTHAICFFSGCIMWLLVDMRKSQGPSKALQAAFWCASVALGLTCVFMKHSWNRGEQPSGEWAKIVFAFSDKIMWSVFLSWITYACATARGGLLCDFLSWEAFAPFSKLTYGIYLIHFPFYHVRAHISRERMNWNIFHNVTDSFAVFVWASILGYFMFIMCEAPTSHLEKLIFLGRQRARSTKNNQEINKSSE
ncbi:unnamed protein product, partial [Ixodes pacificus]